MCRVALTCRYWKKGRKKNNLGTHVLDYVASVKTADFVTVYAQISFLGSFMFSLFIVPKDR